MIGIVLIAHGGLAPALREAMEHVVGAQSQVATVSVGPEDSVASVREEVNRCIDVVDTGDGAILLTDMFGGTPSNVAVSMINRGGVEIISGVNLPMLVKLAKARAAATLGECADCAETAGRKYIAMASHLPSSCLGGSACVSRPGAGAGPASVIAVPASSPNGRSG
jgi:PTS system mannose-specific IIA component